MPVLRSPSSRRSPRLDKHGIHSLTPPSKAVADAPSGGDDTLVADRAQSSSDGRGEMGEVGGSATRGPATPTTPSKASPKRRKGGGNTIISTGGTSSSREIPNKRAPPLAVSPWRKTTIITPRTRGASIARALSSPGDYLLPTNDDAHAADSGGIGGGVSDFGGGGRDGGAYHPSPRRRSSAEAALHYLARATTRGAGGRSSSEKYDDGISCDNDENNDNPVSSPGNGRRKRKAASDACDRLRDICDMDEFDDLDRLLEADKLPYNKPDAANRGRSKLRTEAEKTTTTTTTSTMKDVAMVDSFVPRGKSDERWLRNFVKWTTSRGGGDRSTASGERSSTKTSSPPPSSPLPKRWVYEQRVHYKKLQRGDKSLMTRDRVALLEGGGFVWKVQNRRRTSADNVENDSQSSDNAGRTSAVAHATEGGHERKDGSIGEGTKSGPALQSAGEPDRTIINDVPSGRKSPRKSPPTQFYHSLLGNRSVSGDGASGGPSFDPTKFTSDSASPTATSKKRQRSISPFERLSPSSRGDSRRLLPADIVAKDESDSRGEKKKKVRRGRRSTSSLLALETLAGSSTTEAKVDFVSKRSVVSLSHKELNEVLSKTRNKRLRKKSGDGASKKNMRDEPTSTIVVASTNETNKAIADSKLVQDPSKRKVAEKIEAPVEAYDALPQSPESPLRVMRLLPVLMDGDSVNGTSRVTGVSDLTGKSAADAPCIAELLLSCLSEDSGEKAANSTPTGPTSMTDDSLLSGVSCEMNYDDPGCSSTLPSYLMSSEEFSLQLDSSTNTGVSGAQVESSTSNSKQKNNAGPKASMSCSTGKILVLHSTSVDLQKAKTNEVDPSNEKEERNARISQETWTKEIHPETKELNPVNTTLAREKKTLLQKQREPAGNVSKTTLSMCDKSGDATIEDDCDTVTCKEGCSIAKAYNTNSMDTAIAPKEASGVNSSHDQEIPVGRLAHCTIWTCDICKTATFEDYFDAVAHEEKCVITNKVQETHLVNNEAEEESYAPRVRVRSESLPVETEKYQSTSVLNIGTENLPSPTLRPPLSLMLSNSGKDLALSYHDYNHHIQSDSTKPVQSVLFPSSQLQITENMNIVQDRITEFGRLQMEAHFVTQRMREIEEMMKRCPNTISSVGDIERCGPDLKKRSHRAKSKSTSIRHHKRSRSRYNESSGDDNDDYHLQRRQKLSPDEMEPRMLSGKHSGRRLEIYKTSSLATKGRLISSQNGGTLTHIKYDVSEIDTRCSQVSEKVERHHADRSVSPKRQYRHVDEMHRASRTKKSGEMSHAPIVEKKLKKHNSEPLVVRMPLTSGSKKYKSKHMQFNQDFGSNAKKPSPHKPASNRPDESSREKSRQRGVTSGSSRNRNESKSESPSSETSSKPNVKADAGYSDKESSKESPGEAKVKCNIPPATCTQYEVNKTRDPLYWLAGVESSSDDDESWDFDGPMILPPPPL